MARKVYNMEQIAELVAFDAAREAESDGEFWELRERARASLYAEARLHPTRGAEQFRSVEALSITVEL